MTTTPSHILKYHKYRYGFNGMEKDDEVYASVGNSYTSEFRIYSPRLGRWLSMDPVLHHHLNPYNGFDNNPIYFKDPKGSNSEGGPGDRAINKDIGDGTGDVGKAGTTERIASGTVVYADVSINDAKEKNNVPYSNAGQIAKANGMSEDELYAMNPGLEKNKNVIGQGQKIYISKTNVGVSGSGGRRRTIADAEKDSETPVEKKNDCTWCAENILDVFGFTPRDEMSGNSHGATGVDKPATPYDKSKENENANSMYASGEYSEYSTQHGGSSWGLPSPPVLKETNYEDVEREVYTIPAGQNGMTVDVHTVNTETTDLYSDGSTRSTLTFKTKVFIVNNPGKDSYSKGDTLYKDGIK